MSAIFVAVGTAISAFWILSANSWMQTPAGHEMRDGIAYPVDWLAIIFNPSFPYRFAHMLRRPTSRPSLRRAGGRRALSARRQHLDEGRTMMRMAVGMIAILAPLQLFIGDQHGLNTLEHQPIKIAAMEAHWDGSKPGDSRALRLARREGRDQPLRDCRSRAALADPHARSERRCSRA